MNNPYKNPAKKIVDEYKKQMLESNNKENENMENSKMIDINDILKNDVSDLNQQESIIGKPKITLESSPQEAVITGPASHLSLSEEEINKLNNLNNEKDMSLGLVA